MKPLRAHKGLVVTLDRANVDTDQIIAKQFLKSIARTGFGPQLFYDWRHNPDGSSNADFPLNKKRFQGASILVARNNFGCGSSREHAVWSIVQFGFQVVIAPRQERGTQTIPGFADIFRNNSFKNALLTIELSETEVDEIFAAVDKREGLEATADVEKQTFTLHTHPEKSYRFDLDSAIKERLLNGLDDIGLSLKKESDITKFEQSHDTQIAKV